MNSSSTGEADSGLVLGHLGWPSTRRRGSSSRVLGEFRDPTLVVRSGFRGAASIGGLKKIGDVDVLGGVAVLLCDGLDDKAGVGAHADSDAWRSEAGADLEGKEEERGEGALQHEFCSRKKIARF